MAKSWAEFYAEIESSYFMLSALDVWYIAKGEKKGAVELHKIVKSLGEWMEDNVPSTGKG